MNAKTPTIHCYGNSRLAQHLKQNATDFTVQIFSRDEFEAFHRKNDQDNQQGLQLQADVLFISIRPVKTETQKYWNQFFSRIANQYQKVVLISTTSVYQVFEGKHCDFSESGVLEENHPMVLTERTVLKHFPAAIILRPSGLFDNQSHPIQLLAKKENSYLNLAGTVNLVHRDDVARAALMLITQGFGGIFNVSYPSNPLKSEYYQEKAKKMKLQLNGNPDSAPKYPSKSINTKKLLSLGYQYHNQI